MTQDRRCNSRVSENRIITEIVSDCPSAASVVNLSHTGIRTIKPITAGRRGPRVIQMEIPIPEICESIWATGEIMFESMDPQSINTGIRFLNMASTHQNYLTELVKYRHNQITKEVIREAQWRSELSTHPSPFTAPPPPRRENTVKMYLLPKRPNTI